jgi:hypothetical protein
VQANAPVTVGDGEDAGVELDALLGAAGAVVVTVAVVAGAAGWLLEDEQPATAATQANAAAATASRPALECLTLDSPFP